MARLRLATLFGLFAAGLLAHVACAQEPETARPNIVLIVADDLGLGDVGAFGGKAIATPHIDRLVAQGLRFTDFHSASPVCSPTRASLLTGRYPQRSQILDVLNARTDREHGLAPGESLLPRLLRDAGYATDLVGKWHLGYEPSFHPLEHGFERFRGFLSGNVDYVSRCERTGVYDWWEGREPIEEEGYLTHLITARAVETIERNKDRPFFLMVSQQAPHIPLQGPRDPPVRELGRADDDVYPEDHDQQRAYREMVEALDASVGQILAKLEELELAERTLVFFLSDNGAARFGSNLPWRGTKGTLFEGGQRVVAAARWTERIPAGSICDSTLMSFDLVPTLLAVAGVDPPESAAFDGVSFERALVDGVRLPERSLFWAHAGEFAMRQGPWKLLIRSPKRDAYGESQVELYDLSDDPGERVSQTYSKRKLTRAMFDELKQWIGEVGLGPKPEAPARGDGF